MEIGRRDVIIGAAGTALLSAGSPLTAAKTAKRFPRGFRWSTSTAGYQIEGNSVNADLWFMEGVRPQTFKDRSGDACDSYHRWDADVALLKAIGVNTYRFSVEWSRIEPVRGIFSTAELDHYKRCIEALHQAGIAPMATFFHVAAPRWFAENGGWLSPEAADLFARYCDKVARELGDGLSYACTINEPQVGLTFRALPMAAAYFKADNEKQAAAHAEAARRLGVEQFVTMNHPDQKGMQPQLIAGHHQAFAAIKAARPTLPAGVCLNLVDYRKGNEGSDIDSLRRYAYADWLEAAKRSGDFVGVQTYTQMTIPGPGLATPAMPAMPRVKPGDILDNGKQPVALRNMVEYAHAATGKPVFVTENGLQTDDDERRAWYIPQAIAALHDAMAGGVPVLGYSYWSLIDNFEWLQGYKPKFGLATVDRQTFQRALKPSAAVYRRIVRANAV